MTKKSTYPSRGKSLEERFWEKVDKSGECWIWTSSHNGRYGIFWTNWPGKKNENAHRVSWMLANNAEIPSGLVVMHSCDNGMCVNPAHLSLGTPKENSQDAARKGIAPRGERNGGGGKLNESQVKEILANVEGLGCWRAAARYGVSTQTIKQIRRRKIWRHVNHA